MKTASGRGAGSGAGSAKRKRSMSAKDEGTREIVLKAALDCICDLGYYQASSNEIARRAGVSWGVIQYYFGSREILLLAALEDAVERGVATLDGVVIVGTDTRIRLRQLLSLVLAFYGRKEYAAILQILWNLSRAPKTAESTEQALLDFSQRLNAKWRDLLTVTIGEERSAATSGMVFNLMWGMAMEEAANAYMALEVMAQTRTPIEMRIEMLLDAIEGMLQHERG